MNEILGRVESWMLGTFFAAVAAFAGAHSAMSEYRMCQEGMGILNRSPHIADAILPLMAVALARTAFTVIRHRRYSRAFPLIAWLGIAAALISAAMGRGWL